MKYSIRKAPYGRNSYAIIVQRSNDHPNKEPIEILGIESRNSFTKYTSINLTRLGFWLLMGASYRTGGVKVLVRALIKSNLSR